jgi:hypothetical protein
LAKKQTTPVRRQRSAAEKTAVTLQPGLAGQSALATTLAPRGPISAEDLHKRLRELNLTSTVSPQQLLVAINHINPNALVPITKLPEEVRETLATLKPTARSFHGAKMQLSWFPQAALASPCADRFGYMTTPAVRTT